MRTVARTLVAADAACCLSQLRDCSVVAYQICPAGLLVILIGDTLGHFTFIDAFVVVKEDITTIRESGDLSLSVAWTITGHITMPPHERLSSDVS